MKNDLNNLKFVIFLKDSIVLLTSITNMSTVHTIMRTRLIQKGS